MGMHMYMYVHMHMHMSKDTDMYVHGHVHVYVRPATGPKYAAALDHMKSMLSRLQNEAE